MTTDLIVVLGQSNIGGGLLEAGSLALTNPYWYVDSDGRIKNGRDGSGNQVPATVSAAACRYSFQMAAGGGTRYGFLGKCNDQLVSRGASAAFGARLFFRHWAGGTDSAEWVADVASSPDVDTANAIIEKLRLKLAYPLSMSGIRMGAIIIYQGESNALGTVGATDVEWPTHWGSICDNLLTVVSNAGVSWAHATNRFLINQLPPTYPTNLTAFGGSDANWQLVRAAQSTFATVTRSDCVLRTGVDWTTNTGENHHGDWEGQSALGEGLGDILYDDFGLR